MKVCTKCKVEKELSEFYKDKSKKDGLQSYCKGCNNIGTTAYQKANPDKEKARKAAWKKANPAKVAAQTVKRYAAKLQRTPKWLSKEQLKEIEEFYIDAHAIQGFSGIPQNVDHIVPLQGENVSGLHVPWNLQIMYGPENWRKRNKYEQS